MVGDVTEQNIMLHGSGIQSSIDKFDAYMENDDNDRDFQLGLVLDHVGDGRDHKGYYVIYVNEEENGKFKMKPCWITKAAPNNLYEECFDLFTGGVNVREKIEAEVEKQEDEAGIYFIFLIVEPNSIPHHRQVACNMQYMEKIKEKMDAINSSFNSFLGELLMRAAAEAFSTEE